jgi:putative transposase
MGRLRARLMHLPHLSSFARNPVVFITTCTLDRRPLLDNPMAHAVLHEIWVRSAPLNGWFVGQYVVMPDHVHLFACPGLSAISLAHWMQLWKSIVAKRINKSTGCTGTLWQPDYFDRFIRSHHDYDKQWAYVESNPVRKGLSQTAYDWPYRGIIHDLRPRWPRDC